MLRQAELPTGLRLSVHRSPLSKGGLLHWRSGRRPVHPSTSSGRTGFGTRDSRLGTRDSRRFYLSAQFTVRPEPVEGRERRHQSDRMGDWCRPLPYILRQAQDDGTPDAPRFYLSAQFTVRPEPVEGRERGHHSDRMANCAGLARSSFGKDERGSALAWRLTPPAPSAPSRIATTDRRTYSSPCRSRW